nr:MAG: maturation protein [Guiyang fiers-like virus 3]
MQEVGDWSSSVMRTNVGTREVRTTDYSESPIRTSTETSLGIYPVTDTRTGYRSPPGSGRLLHRPFTFRRNESVMCTVTGTQRWLTNGRLRLLQEFDGVLGELSYFDYVPLQGRNFDIPSRHYQLALLKMYSNMRDEKVQLATTLAELVKTVEGVLSPLNQVLNAYQSAKRRDWRGVSRYLGLKGYTWRASSKAVAARWLEVRFGWMPLLGDIKSYTDLANTLATRPLRFTCEGKSYQKPNDFSLSYPFGSHRITREGAAGYRCSAVMQCSSDFIEATKKLSLDAPQLTAWELVPYSWLIDYLIPVGSCPSDCFIGSCRTAVCNRFFDSVSEIQGHRKVHWKV